MQIRQVKGDTDFYSVNIPCKGQWLGSYKACERVRQMCEERSCIWFNYEPDCPFNQVNSTTEPENWQPYE